MISPDSARPLSACCRLLRAVSSERRSACVRDKRFRAVSASVAATGSSLGFITRLPVVIFSWWAASSAWRRASRLTVLS